MKQRLLIGVLVSVLSVMMLSASAQPSKPKRDGERPMFVEIENLDENSYAEILRALEGNGEISIRQVCVPASVMMLDLSASNKKSLDDNYGAFTEIVVTKTALKTVRLLAEYGEDDFLDRCKKVRGSR